MKKNLEIETFDGTFNAYFAAPTLTPAPVIVVIQEIFGVNAGMREIADNLAKQDFLAVCPDTFLGLLARADSSPTIGKPIGKKVLISIPATILTKA